MLENGIILPRHAVIGPKLQSSEVTLIRHVGISPINKTNNFRHVGQTKITKIISDLLENGLTSQTCRNWWSENYKAVK